MAGVQTTCEFAYTPTPTWQHNGVVGGSLKEHGDGLHDSPGAIGLLLAYHEQDVGPVKDLGATVLHARQGAHDSTKWPRARTCLGALRAELCARAVLGGMPRAPIRACATVRW
jgi:hypothetical protein